MTNNGDTIAAVASGAGRAGIGIVRVSGTRVPGIAQAITGRTLEPRKTHYLPFVDNSALTIDVGIAIRFDAPHSFTGEHVLELQGHGGAVVLDMVLQQVLALGARPARPGEFSERAFLNDKLDLAQAEAISDLIDSSSTAAVRAALRSMSGEFSAHVHNIQEELIRLRVWLEAALDFSEEDIDFLGDGVLQEQCNQLLLDFDSLLARAQQGQRLRDGLTIVIAGVTNAGKSSLLNALSGDETAIVTSIEGTTRDILREEITIEGVPIHIVDTAGLRETADIVEQEGIRRAQQAIQTADHVLIIVDANEPALPELLLPETVKQTVVLNKSDLIDDSALEELSKFYCADIVMSAKTGDGVEMLRAYLLALAGHNSAIEGVYIARRRHLDALNNARVAADNALHRLRENTMPELAAEELRLAQKSLDEVTGRFDSEDLLGRIFSDFCIGK